MRDERDGGMTVVYNCGTRGIYSVAAWALCSTAAWATRAYDMSDTRTSGTRDSARHSSITVVYNCGTRGINAAAAREGHGARHNRYTARKII